MKTYNGPLSFIPLFEQVEGEREGFGVLSLYTWNGLFLFYLLSYHIEEEGGGVGVEVLGGQRRTGVGVKRNDRARMPERSTKDFRDWLSVF